MPINAIWFWIGMSWALCPWAAPYAVFYMATRPH
jgi:hypothetical protein